VKTSAEPGGYGSDTRHVFGSYRIEGRVGAEEVREVLHRAGT